MRVGLLLAVIALWLITSPMAQAGNNSSKKNPVHKKAQQDMDDIEKVASTDPAGVSAAKDAQTELEQTEKALEEADVKDSALNASPKVTKITNNSDPVVSNGKGPELLVAPVKEEFSEDSKDDEITAKMRNEATVSKKQASIDYINARETLREVKKEWKEKKNHVKTKDEIRHEREDEAYRLAITRAYKEHGSSKTEKTQVIRTPKGNVKVVFINENEFAENKPAIVSPELREAIKDRGREPASVDDEIDTATQNN